MKGFIRTALTVILMTAATVTAGAQQQGKERIPREQLAESQAKHIAKQVGMDADKTKQFTDTYCRYQREVWSLGKRPTPRKARAQAQEGDENAKQNIRERFDRSQKMLDLREKYYEEYSTFLTQEEIEKVYSIERKMMNKLKKRSRANARRGQ